MAYLAIQDGTLERNPAARIGELMLRVGRSAASEVTEAQAWSRSEVTRLIELAQRHEPGFAPMLTFFLSTGTRRGEALGLRREDVDFDRRVIQIRRSITRGELTTPKSGRGRKVGMSEGLASELFD